MVRLLGILVLLLDAVVIYDIIRSEKEILRKLAWIAIVFFLPLFGPLLYYVVGKSQT